MQQTAQSYGNINLQPGLKLRREFPWRFMVVDVTQPIIGADFLSFYHLLPDLKRGVLIDGRTGLTTKGQTDRSSIETIKTIYGESRYHQILKQFKEITKPEPSKIMSQEVEHYIKTTTGPPETCRPKRLAPDKLKAAKIEFDLLLTR